MKGDTRRFWWLFCGRRKKPLALHRLPWRTPAGYFTVASAIYMATSKTGKVPR